MTVDPQYTQAPKVTLPGDPDPNETETFVTRPYVQSDVASRSGKTCAASGADHSRKDFLVYVPVTFHLIFSAVS